MPHYTRQRRTEQGFSLIELLIVVAIIGILIAIIVPAYQGTVRKANDTNAIGTLEAIKKEQIGYAQDKRGNYGTFDELLKAGYLNDKFSGEAPVVQGYIFTMKVVPKGSGSQTAFYSVNADPQQIGGVGATGTHHYYIDSNLSNIRVNDEQPATASDPAL